jgi:hypothetical protein
LPASAEDSALRSFIESLKPLGRPPGYPGPTWPDDDDADA